jgi:type II secretory pathway pseudopilin PulG
MTHNRKSFTLVEMIVAMGVLSILTVLLFSVLSETSRVISMSTGRTRVYTDLRVVIDQFSRDLQQAVDDDRYNCFRGESDRIHFVATIDNNTGNEEAEVGYYYTANTGPAAYQYQLCKSLQFSRKSGTNNADWDVGICQTNGSGSFYTTPAVTDTTQYATVLEGVVSLSFIFRTTNGTSVTPWYFTNQAKRLPAYVESRIGICDPQDVIRYRGVANVPAAMVRYFTNIVYLPKQ